MHTSPLRGLALLAAVVFAATATHAADEFDPNTTRPQPGLLKQEFLYDEAPFPQCHASTIAETKSGLVAASARGSGAGYTVEVFD